VHSGLNRKQKVSKNPQMSVKFLLLRSKKGKQANKQKVQSKKSLKSFLYPKKSEKVEKIPKKIKFKFALDSTHCACALCVSLSLKNKGCKVLYA
jgi:hypothetical protein